MTGRRQAAAWPQEQPWKTPHYAEMMQVVVVFSNTNPNLPNWSRLVPCFEKHSLKRTCHFGRLDPTLGRHAFFWGELLGLGRVVSNVYAILKPSNCNMFNMFNGTLVPLLVQTSLIKHMGLLNQLFCYLRGFIWRGWIPSPKTNQPPKRPRKNYGCF